MELNKKSKTILSFSLLSAFFMTAPAMAHHSLVGEYDTSVNSEVRGKITKLEWTNPHIWVYLDVTAANGSIEKWQCEMGSPNQLVRQGWKKEDLPVGTIIRASANPARSDPHICSTRRITTDDGKPIFTRGAQ
jgi:hypothetical protein